MDKPNLHGLRILNTRPAFGGGQARFQHLIETHGGISILFPLQRIEPLPFLMPDLSHIDAVIFVSIPAVESFFSQLNAQHIQWPEHIETIAIGTATQHRLKNHGIDVTHCSQEGHSEDLIQQSFFQKLKNKQVLWVKGQEGRAIIGEALHSVGAHTHSLIVYQNFPETYEPSQLESLWKENLVDIILISSQQAFIFFLTLLNNEGKKWLQQKTLLVFSERIATFIQQQLKVNIIITRHDNILATLSKVNHGY